MPAAPSQENLYLGAGELLFNPFDDDGLPTGFHHLGNVETFELTTTDDRIKKYSSMKAARPLYAERTRRRDVVLRVTIDEHNAENLALGLMGDVINYTQAATAVVDEVLVAAASAGVSNGVKLGGYYKTSKFDIGTVTLETTAGASLTPGVDYEVYNAKLGLIHIFEDAANIDAGEILTASYTPVAKVAADGWKRIRGGSKANKLGSLLFVPDPSEGLPFAVQVWNVSVTPDGALGLISEEYSQFALTMSVQDDSQGVYGGSQDEALYAFTQMAA